MKVVPVNCFSQSSSNSQSKNTLRNVCEEFEAIFMSTVWKSQQPPMDTKCLFSGGMGESLFRDLLIDQLTEKMSKTHQAGIADLMEQQLNPQTRTSTESEGAMSLKRNKMLRSYNNQDPLKLVDQGKIGSVENKIPGTAGTIKPNLDDYNQTIQLAAEKYNLSPTLIKGVIMAESTGNPMAQSSKKAMGLMQIMPDTARMLNLKNPWDATENIMKGSQYLADLLSQFDQNEELALAAYNAGPGNVRKYHGIPPFPETQNYVTKVLSYKKSME